MKGVDNLVFILKEGFKDMKWRMNLLEIIFNDSEKILRTLVLKVKQQELIENIMFLQVFGVAQEFV